MRLASLWQGVHSEEAPRALLFGQLPDVGAWPTGEGRAEAVNLWELACREFLKGCSCSGLPDQEKRPEACATCAAAFRGRLQELARGEFKIAHGAVRISGISSWHAGPWSVLTVAPNSSQPVHFAAIPCPTAEQAKELARQLNGDEKGAPPCSPHS